ncbi:MAG TPA: heavy-metal-associated domain-containing protein [Pyrinomonadaceae bacterium]|nr:heavy-metal-associated domain-containing protein [Pyrinomonadaceae bacterium]
MQTRQILPLLILALVMTFGAVGSSAATATVTIRVEGMRCGNCAASITKNLKVTAGVEDVRVSFEKTEAWIKFDDQKITVAKLREVINGTGFKAVEEKASGD